MRRPAVHLEFDLDPKDIERLLMIDTAQSGLERAGITFPSIFNINGATSRLTWYLDHRLVGARLVPAPLHSPDSTPLEPLVYVAGPFTSRDPDKMEIRRLQAIRYGRRLEDRFGVVALVPHHAVIVPPNLEPVALHAAAMVRCRAMLHRCDAAVFLPGWETSRGAREEMELCGIWNIPAFIAPSLDPDENTGFAAWLEGVA